MATPSMTKTRANTNPSPGPIEPVGQITGGADTHLDFHLAAARDGLGRTLGTRRFPATLAGYAALHAWLLGFGPLAMVGIEGTGSYGAGLSTYLTEQGVRVVEVNRPNRQKRRRTGKSDPADAIAAAAAAQSGEATATPKLRHGPVESVRVLRILRKQLVSARTALLNTLHALLLTAPAPLRESLHGLSTTALLKACAALPAPARPAKGLRGNKRIDANTQLAQALRDNDTTVRAALAQLADIIAEHDAHIGQLDTDLAVLIGVIAPRTLGLFGLGPDTTGQLLTTLAQRPEGLHSEAAFARLSGVAPLDASSGKHENHRLSRAGDRQANAALYRITLTRLRYHQPSRDYLAGRLRPGTKHTKKHLIRCLKRYIAREIYPRLTADLAALNTHHQQALCA